MKISFQKSKSKFRFIISKWLWTFLVDGFHRFLSYNDHYFKIRITYKHLLFPVNFYEFIHLLIRWLIYYCEGDVFPILMSLF